MEQAGLNTTSFEMTDNLKQFQNEIERKFRYRISQMAHDLGSPMMVLSVISQKTTILTKNECDILHQAIERIKEISDGLIEQYKITQEDQILENATLESRLLDSIPLHRDDTIIVLDDDISVHNAWSLKFEPILQQRPNVQIKYFSQATDALDFVTDLPSEEKDRIIFLSDYELAGQDMNGMQVLEQLQIKRSVLVTSHCNDFEILKEAAKNRVKILPKASAFAVNIYYSN